MAILDILHFGKNKTLPHLQDASFELGGLILNIKNLEDETEKLKIILEMETHISRIKKARKNILKALAALQKELKTTPRAKLVGERLFKLIGFLDRVIKRIKTTADQRNEISPEATLVRLKNNKKDIEFVFNSIEREMHDIA